MDTIEKIIDRETELGGAGGTSYSSQGYLGSLYARMDADRDAVYLRRYVMTAPDDAGNEKTIPRTTSVTMNEPGVFAEAIAAVLQGAKRQTVIEGLSDEKSHKIEEFLDDCFLTADLRLEDEDIEGLWGWVCNHITVRGPIGVRWTFDADGRPRCRPIDMRYCPFERGTGGLTWAALHTRRKGIDIENEYGPFGLNLRDRYEVYDYWDASVNEIWVSGGGGWQHGKWARGRVIRQAENPYGFVPFVIVFPSTGYNLRDEGYEAYQGESIFMLVRDLYPEWNRLMSVQQTKAIEWVKPPYVHQVVDGETQVQDYPHEPGQNLPYKEGEKPELLQTQDLTRAFQSAEASMSMAIHKGSANITDMADISGMRNASWVVEQTAIRDKILVPRTRALERFYRRLAYLIIREYIVLGFSRPLPLGKAGSKKVYRSADLGDPETYSIDFRYMPENARQKLANYSVAVALKGTLSEDTIIREIMQVDDPDGEIDRLRAEEARTSSPIIMYLEQAERLIDVAEKLTGDDAERAYRKAKIMADRMVDEIKKARMSSVDPGNARETPAQRPEQPSGSAQALLALPSLMGAQTRAQRGQSGQ